jgi:hypothetical protein
MAIIRPDPFLSRTDKELLLLLGALLFDQKSNHGGNLRADEVPMSNSEAERLAQLLEELVESKRFNESAFFVEELTKGSNADVKRLKRIFVYWYERSGRNKGTSWLHWNADIDPDRSRQLPRLAEMQFDYFLKMEQVLLQELPISPRVAQLILGMVSKIEGDIEKARVGEITLAPNSIISHPKALLTSIRETGTSRSARRAFPVQRIAGIATMVANSAVMFTTRDWGVAGTISTMAGAIVASAKPD